MPCRFQPRSYGATPTRNVHRNAAIFLDVDEKSICRCRCAAAQTLTRPNTEMGKGARTFWCVGKGHGEAHEFRIVR